MNIERNRLETFSDWPSEAVVSPARIAKAGFFSIKDQLIVECFSCGNRISEWNYGDQVMARHRLLNPQCPFVLSPLTSGNVPCVQGVLSGPGPRRAHMLHVASNAAETEATTSGSAGSNVDLKIEANRLMTFASWPSTAVVSAISLARAGFYSLKFDDKVKCAFCDGVVGYWEDDDDPDREHMRLFPTCPFVITHIAPLHSRAPAQPILRNLNIVQRSEDLQALGLQPHTVPRHTKFATLESRLRSFIGWPDDLRQTPDLLAQAGFYYVGSGDQVRCFHCDGGLRHWDPDDDPWVEHARWFPTCSFVQTVKGQEFVQGCAPSNSVQQNSQQNLVPRNRSAPFTRVRDVTEGDIQALMSTPIVLVALNVGLHVGRVKKALRYKLERTGTGFSSADALIDATFNMQLEEEGEDDLENEDRSENSALSRQVSQMLSQAISQAQDERREQHTYTQPTPSANGEEAIDDQAVEGPAIAGNSAVGVSAVDAASDRSGDRLIPLSLEEENRLLKEARLCKICMDCEVGIVFLPCGHLATCVNCAPSLQNCAVCRSPIKATVRTFLS